MKHNERIELIKGAGIDSPALKFLTNADLLAIKTIKGVRNKRNFMANAIELQILKYNNMKGLKNEK